MQYTKGLAHDPKKGLPHEEASFPQGPYSSEDVDQTIRPMVPLADPLATNGPLPDLDLDPMDEPMDGMSEEMCNQVVELIWMALLRDVKFSQFESNVMVEEAARELGRVGVGQVSPSTIFRADFAGVQHGDFVSKVFTSPVPHGWAAQSLTVPDFQRNAFGVTLDDAAAIQNGIVNGELRVGKRQVPISHTPRSLTALVHKDYALQFGLTAALVLAGNDVGTLAPRAGEPVVHWSINHLLDILSRLETEALRYTWDAKWTFLQARPEEFGIRAENQRQFGTFGEIPKEFFDTVAVKTLFQEQGNYLLPLAYPEGAPMHPSYPAGHSVLAGAYATLLKVWFDNEAWPTSAPRDGYTVHGEINKAAYNGAVARSFAGIHYREDNVNGMLYGEQIALALLPFLFDPRIDPKVYTLELTKLDGTELEIEL